MPPKRPCVPLLRELVDEVQRCAEEVRARDDRQADWDE